jgi:VTC domain-containing protein
MVPADGRPVALLATEIKFLIPIDEAARVREWARARLAPDPYGAGEFGDEYRTTSLYFDTAQHDVFHRRGSFGRSKQRIRRYGSADVVFLERKLRTRDVVHKRRTLVPLAELSRLEGVVAEPWSGGWFDRRVRLRGLRPVCVVSYRRTARVLGVNGSTARLTVDDDVRGLLGSSLAVDPAAGVPLITGWAVLELKFHDMAPALFRQLVEEYNLQSEPASKYRLTMSELAMAGAERAEG